MVRLRGRGARRAQLYLVTAPNLQSRSVLLNGRELAAPDGVVPVLRPVAVRRAAVSLPPASYAFIVQPAKAAACAAAPGR